MRLISIFFVLLIAACSGTQKTQVSEPKTEQPTAFTNDSIFLSFERTVCFGECPAFKVTIYPDGRAVYEGRKFVEMTGRYSTTVTKAQIDEIRSEAKRVNFFGLADKYDASVSDVPSTITILSGPDGLKKVLNRFGGPEELKSFEKKLDTILLGLDWEKSEK